MRTLTLLFFGLFGYGLWVGLLGAALLSLAVGVFTLWAEAVFAAQDRAFAADPRNAKLLEPATSDALVEHDCECS